MAIAHGTEVQGAASTTAGAYTTAITPAAAPAAACVVIVQGGAATDLVTSVTYGGVTLTRRRFDIETTEAGAVYIYWGAGNLPTGTQNVVVNRTSTTNLRAVISTMTVATGQTVAVDIDGAGSSAAITNPSWAMTTVAATTACYLGIHSGITTMVATPATNWTIQGTGWTISTSEDFVGSSIAFKEAPIPQVVTDPIFAATIGRQTTVERGYPGPF
jgi:hypothetical protein